MKSALGASLVAIVLLSAPTPAHAQDSPAGEPGVSYEQLLHPDATPQDWLMYGGDYSSQRYSRLTQINRENVRSLKAAWIYQPNRPQQPFESSPVVVNGIMYVTEPLSTVTALDARLGTKI